MPTGPEIPHFDKVLHFGYFFGGSIILSTGLFFRFKKPTPWKLVFLFSIMTCALVGAIDEHHQSWVPERSGHDVYDWTADVLGASAGAGIVYLLMRKQDACSQTR